MRFVLAPLTCALVAPAAFAEPPAAPAAAPDGGAATTPCPPPPLALWSERKVSTPLPGMWGAGLGLWVASYAVGAIAGASSNDPFGWWPILGPIAASALSHDTAQVLWAVDSVVQVGGFVVFLVGLAAGPAKVERVPVWIDFARLGGAPGVLATLRF